MYELTKHEEFILLSILRLPGNAYLVTLRAKIKEITGRAVSHGSLCNTLSALIRKGCVLSRESRPLPRQGGRRKVLYTLTEEGRRALRHAYLTHMRAWDGLARVVLETV
jgi:PadR family transcriptional regulator PadR